jgi:hypothetical protein
VLNGYTITKRRIRRKNIQAVVASSMRYSNNVLQEINKTTINLSKGKDVLIEIRT